MNNVRHAFKNCSAFYKEKATLVMHSLESNRKSLMIFYFSAISISILAIYSQIFSFPGFNPEWALFYQWNSNVSFNDFLNWYNPFKNSAAGWYRPTSFITLFQIITQFADWHNILIFQIITILTLVVNSLCIYYFTKQIFEDEFTPILTSIFSFIHPIFFYLISNIFMIDFLYQIFILWFVILFCGNFFERKNAYLWCVIAFVLYLLALTSKEQAIGLPFFLIGFIILMFLFNKKDPIAFINKALMYRLFLVLLISIITIFYVYIYLKKATVLINTGEYRTGLNLEIIVTNIRSGILWLSHIFLYDSPSWAFGSFHNKIRNNLYGAIVFGAVIFYIAYVLIRKDRKEIYKLLIVLTFMSSFMLLPVYSGGRPWHYALPMAAFLMIYSRFWARFFKKITSKAVRFSLLCIILIIPLILSVKNFRKEMKSFASQNKPCTEAIFNPPLLSSLIPKGATIAYYPAQSWWHYGCGTLFSFVYKRNDIIQMPIPNISQIASNKALEYLFDDKFFCFAYFHNQRPAWEDITVIYKLQLLEKVTSSNSLISLKKARTNLESKLAPNYKLNEIINFNLDNSGKKYCINGWLEPESWGTWSVGNSSSLLFKIAYMPKDDLTLLINGHSFLSEKISSREIDVYFKDYYLGTLNYSRSDNAGTRSIKIKKKLIVDNNLLIPIRFSCKTLKSISELGVECRLGLVSVQIKENN